MKIAGLMPPAAPPKGTVRGGDAPDRSFELLLARAETRAAEGGAPSGAPVPDAGGDQAPETPPEPAASVTDVSVKPPSSAVQAPQGATPAPAPATAAGPQDLPSPSAAKAADEPAPRAAVQTTSQPPSVRAQAAADGAAPRRAFGFSELGLAGLSSPTEGGAATQDAAAGARAGQADAKGLGDARSQAAAARRLMAAPTTEPLLAAVRAAIDVILETPSGATGGAARSSDPGQSPPGWIAALGLGGENGVGEAPVVGGAPPRLPTRPPVRSDGQRLLVVEQDGLAHLVVRAGGMDAADEDLVQQLTRSALEEYGLQAGSLRLNGKLIDRTGAAPGRRHHGG